jgi:hypothetical protein
MSKLQTTNKKIANTRKKLKYKLYMYAISNFHILFTILYFKSKL